MVVIDIDQKCKWTFKSITYLKTQFSHFTDKVLYDSKINYEYIHVHFYVWIKRDDMS